MGVKVHIYYLVHAVQSHINVTSMPNLFLTQLLLKVIWEYTQGRNHTTAVNVPKCSHRIVILNSTWGHTLEKSHINVTNVTNLFLTQLLLKVIWEYTQGKKPYHCSECTKMFSQNCDLKERVSCKKLKKSTWGHTLEKSHNNVNIVTKIS